MHPYADNIEFYLIGDFHCNMASSNCDNNTRLLSEIVDIYGIEQLIKEPTRVTETTSTLLDLIYTNCPDRVVCSGVSHVGISDHSLIDVYRKLSIGTPFKGRSTIKYRNFKKLNRNHFRCDISCQDWNLSLSDDPNEKLNVFVQPSHLGARQISRNACTIVI